MPERKEQRKRQTKHEQGRRRHERRHERMVIWKNLKKDEEMRMRMRTKKLFRKVTAGISPIDRQ